LPDEDKFPNYDSAKDNLMSDSKTSTSKNDSKSGVSPKLIKQLVSGAKDRPAH
jgi:hypothetical protein